MGLNPSRAPGYLAEMCSGSKAGSYLRLIDFVYHSTLSLRVIKKKKNLVAVAEVGFDAALGERVARRDCRLQPDVVFFHVLPTRALCRQQVSNRVKKRLLVSASCEAARFQCVQHELVSASRAVTAASSRMLSSFTSCQHAPFSVSIRQHSSAFVSIRQHSSAFAWRSVFWRYFSVSNTSW